jgi:2-polyprenyl-3-methyl-5-hydroxy-6-metoxy-1,4-benzoquinol methylase
MVYANPVEQELASGEFYDRLSVPFYLSSDKLTSDYSPVRFERELRLFRSRCRQGSVLDVGCSTGAFLFQLKQLGGYAVTGTDVAGPALDYAESRGINVLRESFLEHDFGSAQFDAITFWAVLEHLMHPRLFLEKAAGLLKPGGYCFILVPNLKSLAVRLLGPKYRYVMPDHVNYFSASTLRTLVEKTGRFEVTEIRSTHFNPIVILKDFRGGAERVEDSERAHLLRRTTTLKQNPLLKPLKVVYSVVETFLASLKLADNLVLFARKKG